MADLESRNKQNVEASLAHNQYDRIVTVLKCLQ